MKKQQKGSSENIIIRRDSVAAGDDVFAPHEIKIKIEIDEPIERTLHKIVETHYLPNIQGGKATWIVDGKNSLAVMAQQWSKPYFLVASDTPTKELIDSAIECQLTFRYWCQVEPNEVAASIEQDKPLPDKYGRDKKKRETIVDRISKLFFKG